MRLTWNADVPRRPAAPSGRWFRRLLIPALAAGLSSGCASVDKLEPGTVTWGMADFTRLAILGDSFAAGVQSAGLVERCQKQSFAYRFAEQVGVAGSFAIPTVAEPGVPALYRIQSLSPTVVVAPPADCIPAECPAVYQGRFTNLLYSSPYNNLAVPGASVGQMLTTNFVGDPRLDYFYLYAPFILRPNPTPVSALTQALALNPTFAVVELGINDVLQGAMAGDPDLMTPLASFKASYWTILQALVPVNPPDPTPLSGLALVNIPLPAAYPYMTTVPWFVTTPSGTPVRVNGNLVPLIGIVGGQPGPLPAGSLVTLAALDSLRAGVGIPALLGGTGRPLPDFLVLDNAGELAAVAARVEAMNAFIRFEAESLGAVYVDVNALLLETGAEGRLVAGVEFNTRFITGGFFSLDGVHPSSMGQAFVANELIAGVNARFGSNIPPVDFNVDLGVNYGDPVAGAGDRLDPPGFAPGYASEVGAALRRFFSAGGRDHNMP